MWYRKEAAQRGAIKAFADVDVADQCLALQLRVGAPSRVVNAEIAPLRIPKGGKRLWWVHADLEVASVELLNISMTLRPSCSGSSLGSSQALGCAQRRSAERLHLSLRYLTPHADVVIDLDAVRVQFVKDPVDVAVVALLADLVALDQCPAAAWTPKRLRGGRGLKTKATVVE